MRVLIVDDHPMVIAGCRGMLHAEDSSTEVIEARKAEEALDAHAAHTPDVTVLDINMPELSGYELLRRMLKRRPKSRIVIFTMNADPVYAAKAIELGAMGYVAKGEDPAHFVTAVRRVAQGERYLSAEIAQKLAFFDQKQKSNPFVDLTPREVETLRLLADGKSLDEIAHALKICYKSAANCCALLNRKLGARSRADLVRIAVEAKAEKHFV